VNAGGVALKRSERRGAAPGSLLRLTLLVALAAGLSFVAERWLAGRSAGADTAALLAPRPAFGPKTFDEALADSAARIATKEQLARMFPGDWVRLEAVAYAYADRFRLTGDYADLAKAREAVTAARRLVPPPAGPILADAEIAMAGHRLGDAARALADFFMAVAPEASETRAATAMAGDIALYRGDMGGAAARYHEAGPDRMRDRLAILAKAQGRFDDALQDQRAALAERRRPTPFALATLALRSGAIELARGDKAAARALFEQADRQFPGYWLTQAHLAQADAVDGHPDRAVAAMRSVAEKSGSAEAMDALAMLLRSYGRASESRQWAARAGSVWERRLALAPEAAWGHAIEHELVFGSPDRALDVAQRNLANRPFGESRILMANALMLNGRTGEAIAQLKTAEDSGWRSAPMYALRATLLELAGQARAAETAREQAQSLNPHIFEPWTALVWFSHG
jgi:tetratricopeptide (TPR) repeat protein